MLADVPVESIEGMLHGVDGSYFAEELETRVSFWRVREICNGSVASASIRDPDRHRALGTTYGHERIDTNAIPMMKAYLTRKAMRYAVSNPPANIAVQSFHQSQYIASQLRVTDSPWD